MFFMASASNLLMAYLSLEFVSLTSYVLTGYLRHNRRSGEAALKYLIYGGVASGTMIYGMSWIFGLAGSMDYAAIQAALGASGVEQSRACSSPSCSSWPASATRSRRAVPHVVARRVQGAPMPVTAFLSVAPRPPASRC